MEIWRFNTGQYDYLIDRRRYRYPTKIEEALSAVRMRPRNPAKQIELGKIYFDEGEHDLAIESMLYGLSMNTESYGNFILVGLALSVHGRPELAKWAFAEAILLAPAYIERLKKENPSVITIVLKQLIIAHRRVAGADSRSEISKCYKQILQQAEPHDANFHMEMGRFFDGGKQVELALQAYEAVLAIDAYAWSARVNYGWNLYLSGEYGNAIAQYQQVLAQQPNSVAAFNLGLALVATGRMEEARAAYAEAADRHGWEEARRIGAIDDLYELAGGDPVGVVSEIIARSSAND